MKATVQKLVGRVVANDCAWRVLEATVLRFARFADWQRHKGQPSPASQMIASKIRELFPDLVVRHGPFKGMKYPSAAAAGSSLFPKLLGCYEQELQAAVTSICQRPYATIVDVGCAEGYYAVGLAMRLPQAQVYAFDIDPRAIALCRDMAAKNGVSQRVTTGAACDPAALLALPLGTRSLIVCDCEGYEIHLFTPAVVAHLARHDLLIEVHDQADPNISSLLRERFAATHDLAVITSIDDFRKAQRYAYPELAGCDFATRQILLAEHRETIMEWYLLTGRATA